MCSESARFTSLPLAKFSSATDPIHNTRSITWQHYSESLILVLDDFRLLSAASPIQLVPNVFKVTEGNRILEEVNIPDQLRKNVAHVPVPRKDQLPTFALFRESDLAIAIRYPVLPDCVHRVQLKFTSTRDYRVVFEYLNQLGFPMQKLENKTPISTPRPGSSSLAKQARRIKPGPRRPSHSASAGFSGSIKDISFTPPMYNGVGRCSTAPSTSKILDEGNVQSRYFPVAASSISIDNTPKVPAVSKDEWEGLKASSLSYHNPVTTLGNEQSRVQESRLPSKYGGATDPIIHDGASSTASLGESDKFDRLLPPRRELPFSRPSSKSSSKPSAAAISREQEYKDGLASSKQNSHLWPACPSNNSLLCSEHNMIKTPSTDVQDKCVHTSTLSKQDPVMGGEITNRTIPSTLSDQQRPPTTNSSIPSHPCSGPTSDTLHSSSTMDSFIMPSIAKTGGAPKCSTTKAQQHISSTAKDQSCSGLAQFADLSREDRMNEIESRIVEVIQDDNFIAFCEDVSQCWRRIGLGV